MGKIKIIRYKDRIINKKSSDIITINEMILDCGYKVSVMAIDLIIKHFEKQQFFYYKDRIYELFRTDKET